MYYILQKNVFKDENHDLIRREIQSLGLQYEEVDFNVPGDQIKIHTRRRDVFVFGSQRAAKLSQKLDFFPGSFYGGNHDYFIYSSWYKSNMLNSDGGFQRFHQPMTWCKLNELKFIRPTEDSKLFQGGMYSEHKWNDIVERSNSQYAESLILVAPPKYIYKEARLWVIDGRIITSSYYRSNVQYEEFVDDKGLEFGQRMVDIYQPAEAFCIDICDTPDGWKIVEINCINCSGFYKGDMRKVLIALEEKYNGKETLKP